MRGEIKPRRTDKLAKVTSRGRRQTAATQRLRKRRPKDILRDARSLWKTLLELREGRSRARDVQGGGALLQVTSHSISEARLAWTETIVRKGVRPIAFLEDLRFVLTAWVCASLPARWRTHATRPAVPTPAQNPAHRTNNTTCPYPMARSHKNKWLLLRGR